MKVGIAGWDRETEVPVSGLFSGSVTRDRSSGQWSGDVSGTVTSTTPTSKGKINLFVTADLYKIEVSDVGGVLGKVIAEAELDPSTEKITDMSYTDVKLFGRVTGSGNNDGRVDVSGTATGTVVIRPCGTSSTGCRSCVLVS